MITCSGGMPAWAGACSIAVFLSDQMHGLQTADVLPISCRGRHMHRSAMAGCRRGRGVQAKATAQQTPQQARDARQPAAKLASLAASTVRPRRRSLHLATPAPCCTSHRYNAKHALQSNCSRWCGIDVLCNYGQDTFLLSALLAFPAAHGTCKGRYLPSSACMRSVGAATMAADRALTASNMTRAAQFDGK